MTYSIVARDPKSGQLGVAVATHALAVGGLCPWVAPEAGAVATQAMVEVGYGPRMIDALRQSRPPDAALNELLARLPHMLPGDPAVLERLVQG